MTDQTDQGATPEAQPAPGAAPEASTPRAVANLGEILKLRVAQAAAEQTPDQLPAAAGGGGAELTDKQKLQASKMGAYAAYGFAEQLTRMGMRMARADSKLQVEIKEILQESRDDVAESLAEVLADEGVVMPEWLLKYKGVLILSIKLILLFFGIFLAVRDHRDTKRAKEKPAEDQQLAAA